jgi:hypothetical protein
MRALLLKLLTAGLLCTPVLSCSNSTDPGSSLGEPLLRFSRQPSFAFCPQEGSLFEATVWKNSGGNHSLTGSWLVAGDSLRDSCVSEFGRCLVVTPLAQRFLSVAQVEALQKLLNAIPVEPHQIDYACDACLITRYEFGGRIEDDNPCAEATETYARSLSKVEGFLEALATDKDQ